MKALLLRCGGIFAAAMLFFAIWGSPTPAHAYTWTGATINGSVTASSSRMLFDSVRQQFAVGYMTSNGQDIRFATSTLGATWNVVNNPATGASPVFSPLSTFFATSTETSNPTYFFQGSKSGNPSSIYYGYSGAPSFTTYDPSSFAPFDYFQNGQAQGYNGGFTIVGRVDVAGTPNIYFASSTAGTLATFTTTTVAGSLSANPTVDYVATRQHLIVAYSLVGSKILFLSTSTNSGSSWTALDVTPDGSMGFISNPRVKIDGTGAIWIVYTTANDFPCSVSCTVRVSKLYGGVWTHEEVDTVGAMNGNARPDIALAANGAPVIVYQNNSTGAIRYAYRDAGGTGCSGSASANWTCGTIASSVGGNGATVAVATNASTKVAISYYDFSTGALKAAYTDLSGASSGSSSSSYTSHRIYMPVQNAGIQINNGAPLTTTQTVRLDLRGDSASEMVIASNPDFMGTAWRTFKAYTYYTLSPKVGTQRVYVKYMSPTGEVSDPVFGEITFDPAGSLQKQPQPAPAATSTQPFVPEQPSAPLVVLPPLMPDLPVYSNDGVSPFADEEPVPASNSTVSEILCPQRPNAFSLGGSIVKDAATKHLLLLLPESHVACRVASSAVAASWGVTKIPTVTVSEEYLVSSALPYRPGTIVQDSKTGARYFANTKGRLQWFPSLVQYRRLGYGNQSVIRDTRAALEAVGFSVSLTRSDIHPDGTMFLLDARKGEYAVLQHRELHPFTAATLRKFKENPRRAIRLFKGETYPIGERWDN